MRYLSAIIIAMLAGGCMTQQKAYDWMDKHPVQAAEYSVSRFPIRTDTIMLPVRIIRTSDTLTLPGDTIQCPEPTRDDPKPSVICPTERVITNTDTVIHEIVISKENPAKDIIIQDQKVTIAALTAQKEKYQSRSKKYLFYLILCAVSLAGSVGLNIKK